MSEANLNADPSLWERAFVNGEFRLVYATPEILLMEGSYFLRKVVPDANHPLKKKLIAVAFDEAHCIKNWGKFRPYYEASGRLRELLSDFPFVALSATLTPVGIAKLKKAARLRDPLLVKESIRRYNLMICFARIRQSGFEDLGILIPKDKCQEWDHGLLRTFIITC
jgi:superfamily II DNA helicase RecQ